MATLPSCLATLTLPNQRWRSLRKLSTYNIDCSSSQLTRKAANAWKLSAKAQARVLDHLIDFQTTHWNFSNFERQLCSRSCSVGFSSVGVKQQRSQVERRYRKVSTKQTSKEKNWEKKKTEKTNLNSVQYFWAVIESLKSGCTITFNSTNYGRRQKKVIKNWEIPTCN